MSDPKTVRPCPACEERHPVAERCEAMDYLDAILASYAASMDRAVIRGMQSGV